MSSGYDKRTTQEVNPKYEQFYNICISIPIMISSSMIFYAIFHILPRGEATKLFWKNLYEWDKERIADHMSSLEFKYTVAPPLDIRDWKTI